MSKAQDMAKLVTIIGKIEALQKRTDNDELSALLSKAKDILMRAL